MAPLTRSMSAQVLSLSKTIFKCWKIRQFASDSAKNNFQLGKIYATTYQGQETKELIQYENSGAGSNSENIAPLSPYSYLKDPGDVGLSKNFREGGIAGSTKKTIPSDTEDIMKNNIQAYYKKRWVVDVGQTNQEVTKPNVNRFNNATISDNVPSFLPKKLVELRASKSENAVQNQNRYSVPSPMLNENLRIETKKESPQTNIFANDSMEKKLLTIRSQDTGQGKDMRMNFTETQTKQTALSRVLEERKENEMRRMQVAKMQTVLYDNGKLSEDMPKSDNLVPEYLRTRDMTENTFRPATLQATGKAMTEKESESLREDSKETDSELKDVKLLEKIKDQANNDLESIFLKFKPPIFNFKEIPDNPHGHGSTNRLMKNEVMELPKSLVVLQKRGFCSLINNYPKLFSKSGNLTSSFKAICTSQVLSQDDNCKPRPLPAKCVPHCVVPEQKPCPCEMPKTPKYEGCDRICLPCCKCVPEKPKCLRMTIGRNTCKRITYRLPAFSECDKCLDIVWPRKKECCYDFRLCHDDDLEKEIKPLLPIRTRQKMVLGYVPKSSCIRKFSTSATFHQEEKECKKADTKLPCVKSSDLSGKKPEKKLGDRKVCEKFCMPCCAPARDPPDCFYPYVKPPCKKLRPPRPAYSECKTDFPMKQIVPCECVRPRESTCKPSKGDEKC